MSNLWKVRFTRAAALDGSYAIGQEATFDELTARILIRRGVADLVGQVSTLQLATFYQHTLQVDDAEIKALAGTPKILVPDPGAGFGAILLSTYTVADTSHGAYTSPTDGDNGYADLNWCYASAYPNNSSPSFTGNIIAATDLLAVSGVQRLHVHSYPDQAVNKIKPHEAILFFNDVDNWTDGDPANTLTVTSFYLVVPTI